MLSNNLSCKIAFAAFGTQVAGAGLAMMIDRTWILVWGLAAIIFILANARNTAANRTQMEIATQQLA